MTMRNIFSFTAILMTTVFLSCAQKGEEVKTAKGEPESTPQESLLPSVKIPEFSKDSAFDYIVRQCEFGPRVPNTTAHEQCAEYLLNKLKSFGADITGQKFTATAYDGTKLNSTNIIGSFFPDKGRRIILFSHWDSRHICDQDKPEFRDKPVMGANDGASGVGVLLELARLLQQQQPNVGVDIVFLDSEDYGDPSSSTEDSWCLGSQYWANNPHYKRVPQYGILLDMVGGEDPFFAVEATGLRFNTKAISDKVWGFARSFGFPQFKDQVGGQIIDDHVYVNLIAKIPTIDIIDFSPERGFPSTWHTHNDTPEHISKTTLDAVGKVITNLIYRE